MIYQPLKIDSPGFMNISYGIGVLTSLGAFVTGPIPPFKRIHVTAFLPTKTLFKGISGETSVYNIPPNMALGQKDLTALMDKPTKHYETVTMLLANVKNTDVTIHIEEVTTGTYIMRLVSNRTNNVFQPKNGWTTLYT